VTPRVPSGGVVLHEQLVFVIDAAEELAHLDASFGIFATTWAGGGYPRIIPPKSEANRIDVQTFVLLYSRFVSIDGSSGLPDLHTRAGAVDRRRRDELSRDPRLVWLAENIPAGVFLGGLTGMADRFGLRRTTDESK
jgi:hypothetical protein